MGFSNTFSLDIVLQHGWVHGDDYLWVGFKCFVLGGAFSGEGRRRDVSSVEVKILGHTRRTNPNQFLLPLHPLRLLEHWMVAAHILQNHHLLSYTDRVVLKDYCL